MQNRNPAEAYVGSDYFTARRAVAAGRMETAKKMIIWLNLLAFGGLEAVFLWPLVLGLYWERANAAGALSAMIVAACYMPYLPHLIFSTWAFIRLCPRYC